MKFVNSFVEIVSYNPNLKSLLMGSFSLSFVLFTGLVGGLNKQIWHVKRVSNVARSLHERPSTERPDHRCTYQVRLVFNGNYAQYSATCQCP